MAAPPPPISFPPLELSRFFRLLSSLPLPAKRAALRAACLPCLSFLPCLALPAHYLRARARVRLSLSLSLSPIHPPPPPRLAIARARCCVRYIVYTSVPSLNKLLFIRPVAEMNLRDSYRTPAGYARWIRIAFVPTKRILPSH